MDRGNWLENQNGRRILKREIYKDREKDAAPTADIIWRNRRQRKFRSFLGIILLGPALLSFLLLLTFRINPESFPRLVPFLSPVLISRKCYR